MGALWLDPLAAAANLRKALHSARRSLDGSGGAGLILPAGDLIVSANFTISKANGMPSADVSGGERTTVQQPATRPCAASS